MFIVNNNVVLMSDNFINVEIIAHRVICYQCHNRRMDFSSKSTNALTLRVITCEFSILLNNVLDHLRLNKMRCARSVHFK